MTALNGQTYSVKYINPYSFSISCDTTAEHYQAYQHGGMFIKNKEPVLFTFTSLETQLKSPEILVNDLSKLDAPPQSLIGVISLNKYCMTSGNSFENVNENFEEFIKIAEAVNNDLEYSQDKVNTDILKCLAKTCSGKLPPLCAAVGGIIAQEVLKAVSGKFSPLKQWLLLDAMEVAQGVIDRNDCNSRYRCLHSCLSLKLIEALKNL